ncbi:thyroid receptor-interacting protein 6 [Amia ocellicauda]|uniref:thyroid receptor-interacting protein 6 n=1 Tax=Amia ocellicauda TaxID=2972642 RepID=UPI0034644861
MSGPTWLPPRTLGSPERPVASVPSPSPAFYRPPKKAAGEAKPKYSHYDQNGAGGGMATRYVATGPTGGPPPLKHPEGPGGGAFRPLSPTSAEHYYPAAPAVKEERSGWSPHVNPYELQVRGPDRQGGPLSAIDAEIDSLTSMLAHMEHHPQPPRPQVYDNVQYTKHQGELRYQPSLQGSPTQGSPAAMYPHSPGQYHPAPQYAPATSAAPPQGYPYPPPGPRAYPQPMPASYTTTSAPTGPRFSIQVKSAQPVSTYVQSGRQAEQAYAPPPPRHQQPPPSSRAPAPTPPPPHHHHLVQERGGQPGYLSEGGQGWYHSAGPPLPQPQPQEEAERGYGQKGAGAGATQHAQPARVVQPQRSPESLPSASTQHSGFLHSKGAMPRPEEELDRLTKKLVYDMNHPPTEEYFGRCARCGENVLGDGSGCVAMEQVFHVGCFTCITCQARLRGQPFYAVDKKSYCENCYISTLERCSKCSHPILDRILRAMGKVYHPRCFCCVVCGRCLDGVPFTVDATSQIHCIEDFHRKFAPRCSVCGQAIMPEPGQEETVRIVALDRSFHVNCYMCEECGLLLSSEGEGRGCYPLDGHILCKSCSARRIQELSAKISTDC